MKIADGLDEAFIGIGRQANNMVAVYDEDKCVELFMKRDGMEEDVAWDNFVFNVASAYVGTDTPIFAELMTMQEARERFSEEVEEDPSEPDQFMSDAEADADALASAGFGTNEDYGCHGGID